MSTETIIEACLKGQKKKYLHDRTENGKYFYRENKIYWKDLKTGDIFIDGCGYMSKTTKNRLSRLNIFVTEKEGKLFIKNNIPWNGSEINYTKAKEEILIEDNSIKLINALKW